MTKPSMTSKSIETARKRLMNDLAQLHREPLIGANASPLEDNIMVWYGIVIGKWEQDWTRVEQQG